MLEIKTVKNSFITDPTKDGFCFRSNCSQTLTEKELAKEIAGYNSSFTEADAAGMLNILDIIVKKYCAKGYNIAFPFGTLRANAAGTCASVQESFSPGSTNNQVTYSFTASPEMAVYVNANLEYKQIKPDSSSEAKLYRLTSLLDDASESTELILRAGKILRLHGRNLSFDISDIQQGIFLENESGSVRIKSYSRRGSNIADMIVPATLAAGSYSVRIVTKPSVSYFTATIDSAVEITA